MRRRCWRVPRGSVAAATGGGRGWGGGGEGGGQVAEVATVQVEVPPVEPPDEGEDEAEDEACRAAMQRQAAAAEDYLRRLEGGAGAYGSQQQIIWLHVDDSGSVAIEGWILLLHSSEFDVPTTLASLHYEHSVLQPQTSNL
ncbi:hypothetical protein ABZP36_015036 [Zizania latifolia]